MSSAFLRPMLRPTGGLLGRTARYHNTPLRFTQPLARPLSTAPFARPIGLGQSPFQAQMANSKAFQVGPGPTPAAMKHLMQLRMVASQVSMRPGSQTLEHAATNVKEELGNSASDLAKTIAGANMTSDSVVDSGEASFVSSYVILGPIKLSLVNCYIRYLKLKTVLISGVDWDYDKSRLTSSRASYGSRSHRYYLPLSLLFLESVT